jgi:hypothetical protein
MKAIEKTILGILGSCAFSHNLDPKPPSAGSKSSTAVVAYLHVKEGMSRIVPYLGQIGSDVDLLDNGRVRLNVLQVDHSGMSALAPSSAMTKSKDLAMLGISNRAIFNVRTVRLTSWKRGSGGIFAWWVFRSLANEHVTNST